MSTAPLRVLHQIHLAGNAWGGMEKQFCQWLRATRDDPRIVNLLSEDLRGAAPGVVVALDDLALPVRSPRCFRGLPVPNWRGLRQHYQANQARNWNANVVLSWGRFGDPRPAQLAARIGAASVYWERGPAWFARSKSLEPYFREGYTLYLGNSEASRQMLKQRWAIAGEIGLCRPAVTAAPRAASRRLPVRRRLRLGFAARLQAFKGGVLAVHALQRLRLRGLDVELHVAGDGPDRAAMQRQAQALGVADHLHYAGRLDEMTSWYEQIDLLIHPSLREPYGNVCAEALSAALPVVASAVDGLPEVIDDGSNGYCVLPDLSLTAFERYGGNSSEVYPLVYRPELGSIAAPGVCDPDALAQAAFDILHDPARYAAFSAAALAAHARKFSFAPYRDSLLGLLQLSLQRR